MMTDIRRRLFIFFRLVILLFFLLPCKIHAQLDESVATYKKKYPKSSSVGLLKEMTLDIKIGKKGLEIIQSSLDEEMFLDETAYRYANESIYYSSFYKILDKEASSFYLENGKYTESKVTEFKEKDDLSYAFYDDQKTINYTYSNLGVGSKTRKYVEKQILNPRFVKPFYFSSFHSVEKAKLTIVADNGIDLDFKKFNTEKLIIDFKKEKRKKRVVYTWECNNVDEVKIDLNAPSYINYLPHIIPVVNKYTSREGETVKVLSEVKDLHGWYNSLVNNINKEKTDDELVKLVKNLVKDKTSELEKVKAIYYWAQENIKYIAFEYELGGFVPREVNEIFKKKYGDCKDNSNILNEMLKIAGIKGYLSWVGTRDIPYTYNELPTPAVDNHMILTYKDGDDNYFLDATGRYVAFGMPTSFIQGKEVLINHGADSFEIVKVPVVEANKNSIVDNSYLEIKDGVLYGNADVTLSGYTKFDFFNQIEPISKKEKLKEFYIAAFSKGNNKFIINDFKEENKFSYDLPFKIEYDFSISDYIITSGDEIYINLNLGKMAFLQPVEEDRKCDLEAEYKESIITRNELNIPIGYKVTYLPENLSVNKDFYSINIEYNVVGNKVIYSQNVKYNFLVLKKENFNEYIETLKKVKKNYKETIVLKKI